MSPICILDTSVLCEVLEVPGKSQQGATIRLELAEKHQSNENLLLPLAAIFETGNHIGPCNGDRFRLATTFAHMVRDALDGKAPFVVTPIPGPPIWDALLVGFPQWAATGSGLGDLSIVEVYREQVRLYPTRKVYIWSLDRHLGSYGP